MLIYLSVGVFPQKSRFHLLAVVSGVGHVCFPCIYVFESESIVFHDTPSLVLADIKLVHYGALSCFPRKTFK